MIYLFVFFQAVVCIHVIASIALPGCLDREEQYGIFPRSPYFLETQDIVLECISKKPSPRLAFSWRINENLVQEKFIQFRNDTYIQMVIPNVTAQDVGQYPVAKAIFCIDEQQCLTNEYIRLEYYPVEPQNITCLVDNFQTLFCTWSLGVDYKEPRDINVNCLFVSTNFKINRIASGWAPCPNATRTSCFWNRTFYHSSLVVILNISVANTKRDATVWKTIEINRDEVLKPGKVKDLTVSYTSEPTCANVTLTSPSPNRSFSFYISYKSVCESVKKTVMLSCRSKVCWQQVCGLVPFTDYTFEVVSRYSPTWVEKGYLSDPVITRFKTAKDKPSKSPLTTNGLYLYDRNHLTLFWQPLQNCDWCSDDTVYEISFEGITKNCRSSDYLMETRLHQANKAYKQFMVMILTKNSKGRSADIIQMEVFPEDEGPKDSELIIEYKGNETACKQYLATIKVDPMNYGDFSDIIHTITWCKVSAGACKKPMYWLEDQPAAGNIALPIKDCHETYKFGLITKAYSKTHKRMMWTDINTVNCQYRHNIVPKEPLPNIRLSKVMLPNTVTVEWEPYPCVEPASYIQNYIVTYCEALPPETNDTCDCVQKRVAVTVSNLKSSHTVKDLPTGLHVCIWVSANSTAGQGPKNKHVLYSTVVGGETPVIPIIISIIAFALILLGLFLGFHVMKWFKRWHGERTVEDVPLDIPMAQMEERNNLMESQYPQNDDLDESEDESQISLYHSSSEISIDYGNNLTGYARPKDIPFNSDNSINSKLSQFDGNVDIRGHRIHVPGADNRYASINDLALPDTYLSPDLMNSLAGNRQNVGPLQNTQLNIQEVGSMIDQTVLEANENVEDWESISEQDDGSVEDQTVLTTKVKEEDIEHVNGQEDGFLADQTLQKRKINEEDLGFSNSQHDGFMEDQTVLKTMLNEKDNGSSNGQQDGSMGDQTVLMTSLNEAHILSTDGKDDVSMVDQTKSKTMLSEADNGSSNDGCSIEDWTVSKTMLNEVDVGSSNGQDNFVLYTSSYVDLTKSIEIPQSSASGKNPDDENKTALNTILDNEDISYGQNNGLLEDQKAPKTTLYETDLSSSNGENNVSLEDETLLKTNVSEEYENQNKSGHGAEFSVQDGNIPIASSFDLIQNTSAYVDHTESTGRYSTDGISSTENSSPLPYNYVQTTEMDKIPVSSMGYQTLQKTMLNEVNILSGNEQDDDLMEDQTLPTTTLNEADILSINEKGSGETVRQNTDVESGSWHYGSNRFSDCPHESQNKSGVGSDFSVQDGNITTGSSTGSIRNAPSYVNLTESTCGSSTGGTSSTGNSSSLPEYVTSVGVNEIPAEREKESGLTEDLQGRYLVQNHNAADTGMTQSEEVNSALADDKKKKHESVKVANLAEGI